MGDELPPAGDQQPDEGTDQPATERGGTNLLSTAPDGEAPEEPDLRATLHGRHAASWLPNCNLAAVTFPGGPAARGMGSVSETTERNKALVRRYQDAYNSNNLDILDELLAPDWKTQAFPTP